MRPLIDGDVLVYEIGFACEYGKEEIPTFEYVKEVLDGRIEEICEAVQATLPPKIFLTGKGNFREDIAKKKGYKENRKDSKKPFHYANIIAYLVGHYRAEIVEGMEADDAMAIAQMSQMERFRGDYRYIGGIEGGCKQTVICSRDKDLRMVPGWHYSWECGKQGEIGPIFVAELGEFWPKGLEGKNKKLLGTGLRFFYAQMLMGDSVDNIPGCPGVGPVAAYDLLKDAQTAEELEAIVWDTYIEKYPEMGTEEVLCEFLEQAHLLWMVRELDEEGRPVLWRPLAL